jgi:hypothetical protein
MTGAPVPAGADAVQQVEKTSRDGDRVTLPAPVKPGQNIARRATDMRSGEVVLRPGHRIRAAEIGALAAIGKDAGPGPRSRAARCWRRATSSSRRREAGPGQIRNSNTVVDRGAGAALGLECDDLGVVRDDAGAIRAAIREGLKRDLLILSGGVSAGDWDLVIPALEAEGVKIAMHQVLIKPGGPSASRRGSSACRESRLVVRDLRSLRRAYLGLSPSAADPRAARIGAPQKIERVHYLPARVRWEGTDTSPRPSRGRARPTSSRSRRPTRSWSSRPDDYGKGDGSTVCCWTDGQAALVAPVPLRAHVLASYHPLNLGFLGFVALCRS